MKSSIVLSLLALAVSAGAAHAQVWTEIPDAPAMPPGQMTVGVGPLIDITGALVGSGDVDMYCIDIFAPTAFGAWTEAAYPPGTIGPAGAAFDSQLWLFDAVGTPIMHSDDTTVSTLSGMGFAQPNPIVGPPPPAFAPGRYMLAISAYDVDAVNGGGLEIWSDVPFGGWSGPDGAGGGLAGWAGPGFGEGPYHIVLAGAFFCVPAPGSAALFGLAGVLAFRRRR